MTTLVLDASARPVWASIVGGPQGFVIVLSETETALPGLFHCIDECARRAQTAIADLDEVAVVAGPGSWTGIQCALAAGRSIAFAQNLPLIALSKLDLLVYSFDPPLTRHSAVVMPAGNGLFYGAVFDRPDSPGYRTLFSGRYTMEEWYRRLAEVTDRYTLVTTQPLDPPPGEVDVTIVARVFEPQEATLRVVLANASPRVGKTRFDFEPIFLHDPNPQAWSRRA